MRRRELQLHDMLAECKAELDSSSFESAFSKFTDCLSAIDKQGKSTLSEDSFGMILNICRELDQDDRVLDFVDFILNNYEIEDHAQQINYQIDASSSLMRLGRYREARDRYLIANVMRNKHLSGMSRIDVKLLLIGIDLDLHYNKVSNVDCELKRIDEFVNKYQHLITDKDVIEIACRQSDLMALKKCYAQAIGLLMQSLESCRQIYGHSHLRTSTILNWIAFYYKKQGDIKNAMTSYNEALAINGKYLPFSSRIYAITLGNIAEAYRACGEEGLAISKCEEALSCLDDSGLSESDCAATIYGNLCSLYFNAERLQEAEACASQAMKLYTKYVDEFHPSLLAPLDVLGNLYSSDGRTSQAIEILLREIAVYSKDGRSESRAVAVTYYNLAKLYESLGVLSEAKTCCKHALDIEAKMLGFDHPETMETRDYLTQLKSHRPVQ